MVVMAAVEPGTNTDTTPSCTPDAWATWRTPSVMSTTSPSPLVEKRSSPLWTAKRLEAATAREGLAGLLQRGVQALDLVGGHGVAVIGLGVAPGPNLLGELAHALDHLPLDLAVALDEA